ncbi:MAG: hypothetical protein WC974_09820 [Thermoplasmata archaeon]
MNREEYLKKDWNKKWEEYIYPKTKEISCEEVGNWWLQKRQEELDEIIEKVEKISEYSRGKGSVKEQILTLLREI